jgi:putative nucleotidyltransferase with HDIG domain
MDHPGGGVTSTFAHLVRRFFEVLRARRPGPADQSRVAALLTAAEAALFWAQAPADQAHAVACLRRVAAARPDRRDLARAALLHDVGKRHAPLGVVGRTAASLLALVRLPAPGRLGVYLRHAQMGAEDLRSVGAEALIVSFAAGHHGPVPEGISPDDWAVLVAADEA